MTTPVTLRAALNVKQATALSLLRDGYTEGQIKVRTGVEGDDLYPLAVQHGITAPCDTVEGHHCHEARGEDPCSGCTVAFGRAESRKAAALRRKPSSLPRGIRSRIPLQRAAR